MLDNLLNYIWKIVYGENKVNNVNSIDIDKKKDVKGYTKKFINIVNDKIYLINDVSQLSDELMGGIDQNTYNNTTVSKMKVFKNNLVKRIVKFNSYIKYELEKKYTENNTKPVTKIVVKKKNTKADTKPDNDLVTNDEIKTYIIDKKKTNKK